MDYERNQKPSPQGGGFSPRKLRAMLLGVEKKRKEEEEVEEEEFKSRASLHFDPGCSPADDFKDVNMVSSAQECSMSVKNQNYNHCVAISRPRSLEEDPLGFEFQKSRSAFMPPFSKPAPSKWDDAQKWLASPNSNRVSKGKKNARQSVAKVVIDVVEDLAATSEIKREIGGEKEIASCAKSVFFVENAIAHSEVNPSQHDSSTSAQSSTTLLSPPSTVRSVSMRDMGTEMTPIASQEPSRTGTPIEDSTPILSPSSSRPTTPQRAAPSLVPTDANCYVAKESELSEQELQLKTRREIMMLGTQLGKPNIAAWATREHEQRNEPSSFQTVPGGQPGKDVIQSRAAAWEEAEKAKYLARFKEEEIKIDAWENHQKVKSEAEMRKIEVEVERMKARAHDKLMSKLTAMRHKVEEKRAAAEAKRNKQASITSDQGDYIRRTGRIPSSLFCWSCCF